MKTGRLTWKVFPRMLGQFVEEIPCRIRRNELEEEGVVRVWRLIGMLIGVIGFVAVGPVSAQSGEALLQDDVVLDPVGGAIDVTASRDKTPKKTWKGPGKKRVLRSDVAMLKYEIICNEVHDWEKISIVRKQRWGGEQPLEIRRENEKLQFWVDGERVTDYCEYSVEGACAGAGLPKRFNGKYKSFEVTKIVDGETVYCWDDPKDALEVELIPLKPKCD